MKEAITVTSDLFGGLGSLMKGLSSLMPQDDPNVKLINAQSEVSSLQKQEIELYAEIGRRVCAQGAGQFPEIENKLELVRANLAEAQARLKQAQEQKERQEEERRIDNENRTCPACGNLNPDGVKFCQECGGKLGVKTHCPSCNAKLAPGARFCGECGARLEG